MSPFDNMIKIRLLYLRIEGDSANRAQTEKEIEVLKLLKSSHVDLKRSVAYCNAMYKLLKQEIKQNDGKIEQYERLMEHLAKQQPPTFLLGRFTFLQNSMETKIDTWKKNACMFLHMLAQDFGLIETKLGELSLFEDELRKMEVAEDPFVLEVEMNKTIKKANELKSQFNGMKEEWHSMTQGLNRDLDDWIQQTRELLLAIYKQT